MSLAWFKFEIILKIIKTLNKLDYIYDIRYIKP